MNVLYWLTVPIYTLFLLFVIIILIVFFFRILINKETTKWKGDRISERTHKFLVFIVRVVCIGFIVLFINSLIPYWKDSCLLFTGHYEYIEGDPSNFSLQHKDINEYVDINGQRVSFVFTSRMSYGTKYKVKYLPETKTGISIKKM